MFIDSHCHLDRLALDEFDQNLDNVVLAANKANVNEMLCVCVTLDDFTKMAEKTAHYKKVYLSCGVHPLDQEKTVDESRLLELARHENVVAIGETGLDYFYAPETKELQLDSFKKHIRVAKKLHKPLIIHTRKAQKDTLNIMERTDIAQVGGVLHCFTESLAMAERAMEMGFYISFSGILTFKNAAELRKVAEKIPDDRFLIETDSPYLAPVPFRGKQNQPAYVVEVAKQLAIIRGQSIEEIAKLSRGNFKRLFSLA